MALWAAGYRWDAPLSVRIALLSFICHRLTCEVTLFPLLCGDIVWRWMVLLRLLPWKKQRAFLPRVSPEHRHPPGPALCWLLPAAAPGGGGGRRCWAFAGRGGLTLLFVVMCGGIIVFLICWQNSPPPPFNKLNSRVLIKETAITKACVCCRRKQVHDFVFIGVQHPLGE